MVASGGTGGTGYHEEKASRCVEGSNGMRAAPARVAWFCAALAKTAERLSGAERRDRAKAFLFSVLEDFDK